MTLLGPAQNGTSGGRYRGTIQIAKGSGGLSAVNALGLEDYVAGVISAEVPASWPTETLRAQAVAARTYAVTTNAGGRTDLFTQYADTRSQMYRGVAAETPATSAAVRATAGRVVTYQGAPVTTFFFSTSGGRTENIENSFVGSTPRPWLKSVADPYDTVSPHHRWKTQRMTLTPRDRGAARARQGQPAPDQGDQARRLAAHRARRPRRQPRDDERHRPAAAQGVRAARHVDQLPRLRDRRVHAARAAAPAASSRASPRRRRRRSTRRRAAPRGPRAPGPRIHGVIDPARAGAWASVERREGGRWVRAVDVQLGAGGTYATTLPGPGSYRVRYAGQTGPVVTAR